MKSEQMLSRCPFCGGVGVVEDDGVLTEYYGPLEYWVRCRRCGAMSGSYKKHGDAVRAWNRRRDEAL